MSDDIEAPTHACPICGTDVDETTCSHCVARLCDDADGFDTKMPLYFGWVDSEYWGTEHEAMHAAFESYYSSLASFCAAWARKPAQSPAALDDKAESLPGPEGAVLLEVVAKLNANGGLSNDADNIDEFIQSECQQVFHLLFAGLYARVVQEPLVQGYQIDTAPGVIWTGTDFFAADGSACARAIAREAEAAATRLRALTQ